MVEATDDSFIFSGSLDSVVQNTLAMERFQFAYGWMTQWSKSRVYLLAPPKDFTPPATVTCMSISTETGTNPMVNVNHKVELICNSLDFLCTQVDDPTARYEELKGFIDTFRFPTIIGRLPLTLIRKIVAQNVISRC